MAEREMILRMPSDYPLPAKMHSKDPDPDPGLTEDEFDHYLSIGQIRWIYVNGEMRILTAF